MIHSNPPYSQKPATIQSPPRNITPTLKPPVRNSTGRGRRGRMDLGCFKQSAVSSQQSVKFEIRDSRLKPKS